MLLPVLGKARDASRTAVCLNNQRQIGTSFNMFTEDHEGALPPVSFEWQALASEIDPNLSHQMSMWDNLISQYMKIDLTRNQIRQFGVDKADLVSRSTQSFSCPSDTIARENPDLISRSYSVILGVFVWSESIKISNIANDSLLMSEVPFSRNYFGSNGAASTSNPEHQSFGGIVGLHGNYK